MTLTQEGTAANTDVRPPSHPGVFRVERRPGAFNSELLSSKAFKEGEVIARLEGLTKGPKAYSSVQCGTGEEDHVELNSDLLYMNHSCEPNVIVDVSSGNQWEWHVRASKSIGEGESLCFFYPSTEWRMEQAFDCRCGTKSCLGVIRGAFYVSREELSKRGFINKHIRTLVTIRDGGKNEEWWSRLGLVNVRNECYTVVTVLCVVLVMGNIIS
ncbi:hypothetical protein FS842_003677 [Serendipita sp. 407]|nr:hypothetical protein FS842_003677 [Serendipita sp. 407]